MKPLFYCCILALVLVECTTEQAQDGVIPLDVEKRETVNVSDIFTDVEYLQLELNEEHPVGVINQLEVVDDILYLCDGVTLFQHSLDGKYLGSLKRHGRRPAEYMNIKSFSVSEDVIYIIDRNAKLLKYSLDKEFIAAKNLDFFSASCKVMGDKLLLTTASLTRTNFILMM